MKYGLSSKEFIDNYDIILRQSNYYLFYPFNNKNIIEIPFLKSYSFYIYTYLSLNESGYNFQTNIEQEYIEYYFLDKKEFNENDININNLKSKKNKN